jgi:hypothetical protein
VALAGVSAALLQVESSQPEKLLSARRNPAQVLITLLRTWLRKMLGLLDDVCSRICFHSVKATPASSLLSGKQDGRITLSSAPALSRVPHGTLPWRANNPCVLLIAQSPSVRLQNLSFYFAGLRSTRCRPPSWTRLGGRSTSIRPPRRPPSFTTSLAGDCSHRCERAHVSKPNWPERYLGSRVLPSLRQGGHHV